MVKVLIVGVTIVFTLVYSLFAVLSFNAEKEIPDMVASKRTYVD